MKTNYIWKPQTRLVEVTYRKPTNTLGARWVVREYGDKSKWRVYSFDYEIGGGNDGAVEAAVKFHEDVWGNIVGVPKLLFSPSSNTDDKYLILFE